MSTQHEARRRAVHAIFDLIDHDAGPGYVYFEDDLGVHSSAWPSVASALQFARGRASEVGGIYAAVFDRADAQTWPDPMFEVYRPAASDRVAIGAGMGSGPRGNIRGMQTLISGHRGHSNYRVRGRDRLIELAPVLAPASNGATIDLHLDGDTLIASICVDGQCYETSMDVTAVLERAANGVASYHASMPPAATISGASYGDAHASHPTGAGVRERAFECAAFNAVEYGTPYYGVVLRREDPAGTAVSFADLRDANDWYAMTHGPLAPDGTWSNADTYEYLVIYGPDPQRGMRAIRESVGKQPPGGQVAHVQQAAQYAIRTAGDVLVGAVLAQHGDALCAGWWHSLTSSVSHAVSSAEHGLEQSVGSLGHTLAMFKGPIIAAAQQAANAAALSIPGVGPMIAPMAQKFAAGLVAAATGSGSAKAAAQALIADAKKAAVANPDVAKALAVAHTAVTKATGAYHVAQTVANAASGNVDAKAQIAELAQAAKSGDGAAQQALQLAQDITGTVVSNAQANGPAQPQPDAAAQLDGGDPNAAAVASSGWFAPILALASGYGAGALSWPFVHEKLSAFLASHRKAA